MGKSVHVPSERKLSKKFPMPDPIEQEKVIAEDVETLHRMGYGQELLRRMSGFSNYAISLSTICILAGGITSFHVGLCSVGGASIGLGWPLASLLALAFAATMAQLASAFPTAGGLYHWASLLGGRGWGWTTAWFNLAGLIALGLLLPAYTITGFDASAHTAEETLGAAAMVPRSIVRSVWVSALFGWVMLSAVVVAIPDMDQAAGQGDQAFVWITNRVLPA